MTIDVAIRPATEADRPAILSVVAAAFGDEPVAPIVSALWADDAIMAEFVALDGAAPIGYCALSPVACEPPTDGATLALSPVAVSPLRQGAGVGAALCQAAVDHCRDSGTALLVVLGHATYYPRFGFGPGAAQGVSWADGEAGDHFMAIDFAGAGATPRRVRFHPAFG